MSLSPLIQAPAVIQVHAYLAMTAFALGLVQLAAPKGRLPHRVLGYIWCAIMLVIAGGSFFIHTLNQWHGFSWIHLLSLLVLFSVPFGIARARAHRIKGHARTMTMLFLGGLVIAGVFTFVPGRIMHAVLFGG
jgi:uncharacterized membrane protein